MSAPTVSTVDGAIGQSPKRVEDDRFIRGKGNYVDDVQLPGMLFMAIYRSPFAHATINSIDTSRALAMPGVIACVTGQDLEAHGLAWMPTLAGDTQAVLATDKVRFQGQEVVCVIAKTAAQAEDALEGIDVDYDPLPVIVDPKKALDADAPVKMITPLPAADMRRAAARATRKPPKQLISITLRTASGSRSWIGPRARLEAL